MPSLVDIAPIRQKVTVSGIELECVGLSLESIGYILSASPELRTLLTSGVFPDPLVLLTKAPDAAHMILAAGIGKMADPAEEAAAANLVIEDQFDLLSAIFQLTFPQGFVSFFERVGRMAAAAGLIERQPLRNGADVAGKELDTNSPPPPMN